MNFVLAIFEWFKWVFWEQPRCKHEPAEWQHINMGMGKAQYCKKCGKCLKII